MKALPLRRSLTIVVLTTAASCAPPDSGRRELLAGDFLRLVEAEDSRPAGGAALEVLVDGTGLARPFLRSVAVRALGRLENPELVANLEHLLDDPSDLVRAEAANALAQAVHGAPGGDVARVLLQALDLEASPYVRGSLARSLGRLRMDPDQRRRAAAALVALTRGEHDEDAPESQLLGALLGLESLSRSGNGGLGSAVPARLSDLVGYGLDSHPDQETPARIRSLALMSLARTGGVSATALAEALGDPSPDVRRVAASQLAAFPGGTPTELIRRTLGDSSLQVRAEAVRAIASAPPSAEFCTLLVTAAEGDPSTVVRLLALDALARPCPDPTDSRRLLRALAADPGPASNPDWHASSHALVALAAVDPGTASSLLARHGVHGNAFVRAWAARAAARLANLDALTGAAADPSANVRTVALPALADLLGRRADPALFDALGDTEDPQLLITVSGLLAGTELRSQAATGALAALARISEEGRETDRDARTSLLDLVEQTGEASLSGEVERYLRDYDPAVATRAAGVLRAWTGQRYVAAPRGAEVLPLPTPRDLADMERATVALHMAGRGAIEIRLWPNVAPTNAFRLWTLARSGALDGLTLHRMAPNFVIQGGSPGANEYAGHGAFTRDEVGLPVQWRGTVGLSTRGRDTGDGQIYVNLVHNVRLDHDYTLLGEVTGGMDVVDRVLEGDVIERVEVRRTDGQIGLQ